MGIKLKKLKDQVMVISGASSGIGLTTAQMAADAGAAVVLAARNEEALQDAVEGIRAKGGRASHFAADVSGEREMMAVADYTIREHGRFDTWVNDAGMTIVGRLLDTPIADKRKLFETNFWGVVYGCRAAVPYLRRHGGAIINLGSVASEISLPLQGIYSASKHALKAYTQALRLELEQMEAPISVTLVKSTSVDTMFTEHAGSYIGGEPDLPPPQDAPELVARTILHCAEHAVDEIYVGGTARMMTLLDLVAPRVRELYARSVLSRREKSAEADDNRDSAYAPREDARRQRKGGFVLRSSRYTRAALSDVARAVPLLALGGAVALGLGAFSRGE